MIDQGQLYETFARRGFVFTAHRGHGWTLRHGGDRWVIRESWLGGPCAIDHHPVLSPPEPNCAHQGQDYWPGREAAMDALIDFLMERLVGMGL